MSEARADVGPHAVDEGVKTTPDTRHPTPHSHFWLLPLLVLAAALRFYAIGRSSFWSDEGNTWALIQRSFGHIARDAAADIHPPGYYWLLKLWASVWGLSPAALRSFSALCGVLLVALIFVLAQRLARPEARLRLPLLAGLMAALNPFQIYYSQEARMYMLLALESAALFWLLLALQDAQRAGAPPRRLNGLAAGYALVAAAGLWTHYSFPIVLAAAGLAWLTDWLLRARFDFNGTRHFVRFALANGAVLLLFAPWLPTAWRQVTQWPQGGEAIGALDGLALTLRTLLFGPMRTLPEPLWPWLAAAGVLPLLGIAGLRTARGVAPVTLWLGAPVLLMFALGLFSDAFLKFLLVASPAWCLLVAGAAEIAPARTQRIRGGPALLIALGAAAAALAVLPGYYRSPTARDNYKGIAAWLAAAADPATDLVILDAPGQADVWAVYDPGLPVLSLPATRPADTGATEAALTAVVAGKEKVYALFWATDEADPDGVVEGWLDANLYPGAQSWQGNVRLAQYVQPPPLACSDASGDLGAVALTRVCTPERAATAGAPYVVGLEWLAGAPITQTLNASVQLLDVRDQVIAQQDGPAGGARPSTAWLPGEAVADKHALLIPDGTPPGAYRLVVALYDAATGARLAGAHGDALALGDVEIRRAASPLDAALIPMQQRVARSLGPVALLGYDQYAKGFAYAPLTPLKAGDLLHVTLYWQAPDPMPADWPADATFTLRLGGQEVSAPLAGGNYPTAAWLAGEVVRADFDVPFDRTGRRATLELGGESVRLKAVGGIGEGLGLWTGGLVD